MASFLVMKNSIKRLFTRKSTYILMVAIPLLISIAGLFLTVSGSNIINIGVCANENTSKYAFDRLAGYQNITLVTADKDTINTDYIMGKYDYIILDEDYDVVDELTESVKDTEVEYNALAEKMMSMLMVAYITVTTFFSSSIIRDKKEGIVKRYCYSGKSTSSYMRGNLLAVTLITGLQICVVMVLWVLFLSDFELDAIRFGAVWLETTGAAVIIGFGATLISKSEMMSGVLASSAAVIFAIIGGAFVPYEGMPQIIQHISAISPVRWLFLIIN